MTIIRKLSYLKARVKHRPRVFRSVMKEFKAYTLGLAGLWGFFISGGKVDLSLVAEKPARGKALWKRTWTLANRERGFA